MDRDSFVFYKDWAELRTKFPKQADRLVNAIIDYGIYGIEPTDDDIKLCFELIKGQIDRDKAKYLERAERSRINGSKSKGAPIGNQNASKQPKQPKQPTGLNSTQNNPKQPKQPKQPDNVNDNVNVNVNDNVNDNDNLSPKEDKLKEEEEEKRAQEKFSKDESYAEELLNDQTFWESIAMAFKISTIGWDIGTMKEKVPLFIADAIKSVNEPSHNFSHFRSRFKGWLRAEIDYERRNKRIEKQREQQQKQGPLDEFLRARMD